VWWIFLQMQYSTSDEIPHPSAVETSVVWYWHHGDIIQNNVVWYHHGANIIQNYIGMVIIPQDSQRDVSLACCLGGMGGKRESGVRTEPARLGDRGCNRRTIPPKSIWEKRSVRAPMIQSGSRAPAGLGWPKIAIYWVDIINSPLHPLVTTSLFITVGNRDSRSTVCWDMVILILTVYKGLWLHGLKWVPIGLLSVHGVFSFTHNGLKNPTSWTWLQMSTVRYTFYTFLLIINTK
jgi:hypothetical protein